MINSNTSARMVIFLSFIAITFFFACKKSSTPVVNTSIQNMKVFKDSTIYSPVRMVEGSNILVCCYQTYNVSTALLVTDLQGNLLFSRTLRKNLEGNDIAIETGNIIDLIAQPFNYTPNNVGTGVFIYRYNASGSLLSADSLSSPSVLPYINNLTWCRFFVNSAGNYIIYGNTPSSGGFIMEMTHDYVLLWKQYVIYNYEPPAQTSLSGCVQLSSGDYVVLGNYSSTTSGNNTSGMLVTCLNSTGTVLWTANRQTDNYDSASGTFSPYYQASTSDIVACSNGNFVCNVFPNSGSFILPQQTNALLYEITPSGRFTDSASINFKPYNSILGITPTNDGGVYAIMNAYTGVAFFYLIGSVENENSFYATLNSSLSVEKTANIQSVYPDLLKSVCQLPDGELALFGMIQSNGKNQYNPVIIITNNPG